MQIVDHCQKVCVLVCMSFCQIESANTSDKLLINWVDNRGLGSGPVSPHKNTVRQVGEHEC